MSRAGRSKGRPRSRQEQPRSISLKDGGKLTDQSQVRGAAPVPAKAGPVPDRVTIWPIDDGRYGLDATFHGASGYERAEYHRRDLDQARIHYRFQQEIDGAWTLRFGPLRAVDVATALGAFVY